MRFAKEVPSMRSLRLAGVNSRAVEGEPHDPQGGRDPARLGRELRKVRRCRRTGRLLLAALGAGLLANAAAPRQALPTAATRARVQEAMETLPLYFIENRGQADPRVRYYLHGRGTSVYFTSEGVTFTLTEEGDRESRGAEGRCAPAPAVIERAAAREAVGQRWVLKLDFVGAQPGVVPAGREETPALVSYFKGPREEWQTAL